MERREGKRPMIDSEYDDSPFTEKKKCQSNAEPTHYDPSYRGPPPPSLRFDSSDDSATLFPIPNVASWKQMFGSLQTSSRWSDNDPWLPVRWGRPVYRDGLWHFVVPTDGSPAYMDESTFYRVRNRRYGWLAYPGPIYWDT